MGAASAACSCCCCCRLSALLLSLLLSLFWQWFVIAVEHVFVGTSGGEANAGVPFRYGYVGSQSAYEQVMTSGVIRTCSALFVPEANYMYVALPRLSVIDVSMPTVASVTVTHAFVCVVVLG